MGIPEKLFYAHLCNLSQFRPWVRVSWTTWGEWFGTSPRTVQRAFDRLLKAGWVESEQARKRGHSPCYRPVVNPRNGKSLKDENGQSVVSANGQSVASPIGRKNSSKKKLCTTCPPNRGLEDLSGIEEETLKELVALGCDLDFDENRASVRAFSETYGEEGLRGAITKLRRKKRRPRNPGGLLKSWFDGGLSHAEILEALAEDEG